MLNYVIYNFKHPAGGGSGVDIADDGVVVGLGLISGLSLLASAILVSSIKP